MINWVSTKLLSDLGFDKVVGYDLSPKMLDVANKKYNNQNIDFRKVDLFDWIPREDESVDMIVSNFWAASQVSENIFPEINRVLTKWGKAFLSFYNKNSLMNDWWQPWQSSIEVVLNVEDDILEVPIINWNSHKIFKVYAKSISETDLEEQLKWTDLVIDKIHSHSMLTAMMPPMFFDDDNRKNHIIDFEKNHSDKSPYLWFYLIIVVSKK